MCLDLTVKKLTQLIMILRERKQLPGKEFRLTVGR